MNRTHTEAPEAAATAGKSRFEEQHAFFAGFTFEGNQNLATLAGFYGLTVPALGPRITLAQYLAGTCYGSPHPGYRIALGNVELIVQELEEGVITKVGLRLLPAAARPHRKPWPLRTHFDIGASLVRPSRRLTGAAAR
jgi:NhaP-type Na+/H+ and K+/H+ antiporter